MRIESSPPITPNYESSSPAKQCISSDWTTSTLSTLCSPVVNLWSWIKALFAKLFCYQKNEKKEPPPPSPSNKPPPSLDKLHLQELELFTKFAKRDWTPETAFSQSYHEKWEKLSPVVQEKLENASILAFTQRANKSSIDFPVTKTIEYGIKFIQRFEHEYDACILIINNKKRDESAQELLYEILDGVVKEWKKNISS